MYGQFPPTQKMANLSLDQHHSNVSHQWTATASNQLFNTQGHAPHFTGGPINNHFLNSSGTVSGPSVTNVVSSSMMGPLSSTNGPGSQNFGSPGMMVRPSAPPGMMMAGPPAFDQIMSGPPGMMSGTPATGHMMSRPTGPPGMSGPPGPSGMMSGTPATGHMMSRPTGPPGMSGPLGPPGMMSGTSATGHMMSGPPGPPGMMSGTPATGHMMSRLTGPPGPPRMMPGPPATGHMMSGLPATGQGLPGSVQMMPGPPLGPPGSVQMMPGPPGSGQMMPGPPGSGQMMSVPPGSPGMMSGPPPGSPGMMSGPPGAPITRQPNQKIDPDMMPNPITVMKENEEKYNGFVYVASSSHVMPPPLVTTPFSVQDRGSSSPRYVRSTLYCVPSTKDILNQCKIPLGLVIQPFANVPLSENSMSLVDHGVGGPIRCNRCKAYMNPHCQFIDGGRQYACPICQCSNEVPPEFFSHLDHTGHRVDVLQHPELLYGTVEYVATKDYCKEGLLPSPVAYIFMIDVSVANLQSGLLNLLTQTMLSILDHLPKESNETSPIKVGFMTYDRIIQFYNVKASLAQPQMMVVSDIFDVFVPLVDGFLVNVHEARSVIDNLMNQLPDIFSDNKVHDVIFEPAVRAGMEALKAAKCNGRLFMFHSSLPNHVGPGQLKSRLDSKLLGTDKEKTLLNSVGGSYTKLAEDCVKSGVGIELFLFPSNYTDMATLGKLVSTTGGQIHFYPNFQTPIDGDRLIGDVISSVSRSTAFDAVMRVRCSAGIRAVNFYGGFYMSNTTDIEFGNIDSEKAIAVEIKHDDKMKDGTPAYIQIALLYTSFGGERRLRVHNLVLNCSSKIADIYHSCDLDTLMSFFFKSIVYASLSMPYKTIRENFTTQCAIILACYRKQCSQQSPPGQLILPDSLKLLPMYAGCLLKSDALLSPPIVTLDEKCYQMYYVLSMNQLQTVVYMYPKMMSLNPLENDEITTMRCTGQKMEDDGLYLIDNGLILIMWIGQQVPNELINKIFGVASMSQIDLNMRALPALDNDMSFKLRTTLKKVGGAHKKKLIITKQRDKSEIMFRRMLKEDKGSGPWEGVSYIDYLCMLHKEIRDLL